MKLKVINNTIRLSDNLAENLHEWDNTFHRLEYLKEGIEGNKGGNSAVFRLINTENEAEVSIIKFNRYPLSNTNEGLNSRFQREIDALNKAKEYGAKHIIEIKDEGYCKFSNERGQFKQYRYYIMEKGDDDLSSFIAKDENKLSITEKITLCKEIIKGIRELHELEIYHRDIKPDNIFIVDNLWKIGDLGLIAHRGEDLSFEKNKKIGPANWLSPEAMNKWLCEGTAREGSFDITIDESSDAFQLGQIIWFIFNNNAPIGQVSPEDFLHRDQRVFNMTVKMLQHAKKRRQELSYYEKILGDIELEYLKYGVHDSRNNYRSKPKKSKKKR